MEAYIEAVGRDSYQAVGKLGVILWQSGYRMANVVARVSMGVLLLLVASHLSCDASRDLPEESWTSSASMDTHGFSDFSVQSGSILNAEVTSYFRKALPDVVMPESMSKLISPLSSSAAQQLVDRTERGELDTGKSLGTALCSSGALRCRDDSAVVPTSTNAMETLTNHFTPSHLPESSSPFLETQLLSKEGYEVPAMVFSHRTSQTSFLPRPLAQLLDRLANDGIESLLRRLHLAKGSRAAAELMSTLQFCKSISHSQSVRACANSLEDMADMAAGVLAERGSGHMKLLTASDTGSSSSEGQDMFRVVKVDRQFVNAAGTSDYLACHHMSAPFAMEFCEDAPNTKLYSMTMESMSAKGRTIEAVALCHMDTSKWDSNMDVFKTLDTKPGQSVVCQWRDAGSYTFAATNNT